MSAIPRWTTSSDVRTSVRRRWADGTLPRAFALGESFPVLDLPLRGPSAREVGEHVDAARSWASEIRRASQSGRAFDIVESKIGGRLVGSTSIPARAVIGSYAQAWRMLGAEAGAVAFRDLIAASSATPRARAWALDHPLRAIELEPEWSAMLSAYDWLNQQRGSRRYLREISAPGVDTKFVERHRGPLGAMLDVPSSAGGFVTALGLAAKPATVRLRCDPSALGLPGGISEATLRLEELSAIAVHARTALIVENEITYLSVPIPECGVVIWGKGYDVDESASLSWLSGIPVWYWGDLDTHGFSILNRVRALLPHARSFLMDRETLLVHEDRWGSEPTPTSADLGHLDRADRAMYEDLVTDRYAQRLRLEQERIDWRWALSRLPASR